VDENLREHQDLVRAIRRGDPEEARTVAMAHIRDSQTMVIDSLLASESLLSANVSIGPRPARRALIEQGAAP
jgi:DNA-binding GntR family transcriptional regulator